MYNSVEIAQRIKSVAKSKNIIIKNMLSECELSKNTLSSMLSGGSIPKSENLAKMADCLGVSVDYLLGRTEEPQTMNQVNNGNIGNNSNVNINKSNLSDTDSELITEFKKLTFTDKAKVMSLIAELSQKE